MGYWLSSFGVWVFRIGGAADELVDLQKVLNPATVGEVARHPQQRLWFFKFVAVAALLIAGPGILMGAGTLGPKLLVIGLGVVGALGVVNIAVWRLTRRP